LLDFIVARFLFSKNTKKNWSCYRVGGPKKNCYRAKQSVGEGSNSYIVQTYYIGVKNKIKNSKQSQIALARGKWNLSRFVLQDI
jgi:hypothetical protein